MIYVLNGQGLQKAVATKKEAAAFIGEQPENTRPDFAAVANTEDLQAFSVKVLTQVFNDCQDDEAKKISKLKGKDDVSLNKVLDALNGKYDRKTIERNAKAAEKAAKAAEKAAAAGESKTKAEDDGSVKTPREGSKSGLLYQALVNNPKGQTIGDLVDASGYDEQNARTCIGILRSKKNIPIAYDRESKIYTLSAAA